MPLPVSWSVREAPSPAAMLMTRSLTVPSSKLTIGYWSCRGLGAPLRMMAAYSQAEYDDKHYEVTSTNNTLCACGAGAKHAITSSSARAAVHR